MEKNEKKKKNGSPIGKKYCIHIHLYIYTVILLLLLLLLLLYFSIYLDLAHYCDLILIYILLFFLMFPLSIDQSIQICQSLTLYWLVWFGSVNFSKFPKYCKNGRIKAFLVYVFFLFFPFCCSFLVFFLPTLAVLTQVII